MTGLCGWLTANLPECSGGVRRGRPRCAAEAQALAQFAITDTRLRESCANHWPYRGAFVESRSAVDGLLRCSRAMKFAYGFSICLLSCSLRGADAPTPFQANSDLVVLRFTVLDSGGQYMSGLEARDVRVFEDGWNKRYAASPETRTGKHARRLTMGTIFSSCSIPVIPCASVSRSLKTISPSSFAASGTAIDWR